MAVYERMLHLKEIVNRAMDQCRAEVPGSTPIEIMVALVAVAGSGIKDLPPEAKNLGFGTMMKVLAQEANIPMMAQQIGSGGKPS